MKIDVASGAITIVIGVGVTFLSTQYRIGTLASMNTGYFPLVLGILLILLGAGLLISGLREANASISMPPLSSSIPILLAPIIFALLVERFGLVVALTGVGLLGAFAHRQGTYLEKILTTAGVSAAAVLIFVWGIGLPIPFFKWGL